MKAYERLASKILNTGIPQQNRTGVDTISTFGEVFECDLRYGFPLLTTKKMFWKGIVHELLWFIGGNTNIRYLNDNGVHIWDEWADPNGDLGPVYGSQLRNYGEYTIDKLMFGYGADQLEDVINDIQTNPTSRRHIISLWNPNETHLMKLPPCHGLVIQFYVEGKVLHLQMYQRSVDVFLGLPFNIASYALLLKIVSKLTDLTPGRLRIVMGDTHIYVNHIDQIKEQLKREPRALPNVYLPKKESIDDYRFDDFRLKDYNPHPRIKGEVAV